MSAIKKATTKWENANQAFILYQDFLQSKPDPFVLSVADLMFISNFKGGNASVFGTTDEIIKKLESYSSILREIHKIFQTKHLCDLTNSEVGVLADLCIRSFKILDANSIKGFSYSYWSAMLCAFFPNLLPILDRWVVTNLGIPHQKDSQTQVKNIQQYYPEVIRQFYVEVKKSRVSVRELDKQLFSQRP
jgi:hypothetical protein